MTGMTLRFRCALVSATAVLACSIIAGCGRDDGNAGTPVGPTPAPSPAPGGPPQYTETPVPFDLTESRTFDVFGWDSWPSAPAPSTVKFRWNAAIGKYEVLAPGHTDWSRLEAVQDSFGGRPIRYDVFASGGTKLPFYMLLWAPPHVGPDDGYVGNARIFGGPSAHSYFAFGMATGPGDVPASGTAICSFGEDEIGSGELTVDRGARTVTGWVEPFWGGGVKYTLNQTSLTAGATTFATAFATDGVLEGRFFGPRAANVAVRAKGGGQGFSAVSGIMTGTCGG